MDHNISHTSHYMVSKNNKKPIIRKSKSLNFKHLKQSCDIGLSTVVMKREILKKGKLFANFSTKEDYYLWLKIAKTGEIFHYINLPLSYWKRTPNSLSSSLIQKLIDSYKVYFHFEKSFFISIYRTIILSLNFMIKKKNDN